MDKLLNGFFSKRNTLKNIAGLIIGAIGGYLYYFFVGCKSGTCAITANPYMSILWGAVLGYLLFDMFKLKEKTAHQHSEKE